MENQEIIEALKQNFPDQVEEVADPLGDFVIKIDSGSLLDLMRFLKKSPHDFGMLLDLTCIDFPKADNRFEMVYHVFSLSSNQRIRIKTRLRESSPVIASLTPIWKNANWLEREIYDMFGIRFDGHPDLRRLFMYDGFEGYPLRKDYPLRNRQPRIPLRKGYDD